MSLFLNQKLNRKDIDFHSTNFLLEDHEVNDLQKGV